MLSCLRTGPAGRERMVFCGENEKKLGRPWRAQEERAQLILQASLNHASVFLKIQLSQGQWCPPLIPVLRKQRQADLCKFKNSLVCLASSGQSGLHRVTLSPKKQIEIQRLEVIAHTCNPVRQRQTNSKLCF